MPAALALSRLRTGTPPVPKISKKLVARQGCFATLSAPFLWRFETSGTGQFLANADNQSIGPQGPHEDQVQVQVSGFGELAVPSRRVYPGHDPYTQEAELRDA